MKKAHNQMWFSINTKFVIYNWIRNKAIFLISILAIMMVLTIGLKYLKVDNNVWKYISIICDGLTFLTFLTALSLGFSNIYKTWEDSLPKRLSVFFLFADPNENGKWKLLMACEHASLTSEADIRAWGQQVGRQMVDQSLNFEIDFNWKADKPYRLGKMQFKPYFAVIKLTNLPNYFAIVKRLQFILWDYDFQKGKWHRRYILGNGHGEQILNHSEFMALKDMEHPRS